MTFTVKSLTGNKSAAMGAALCEPDLIAAYPITPQSSVVETLASMVAEGQVGSRIVQVESEHSAMSVVQGATMCGGRTFTATSAQGLALMFEPYFRQSTLRLPMVMALATREMTSPETVFAGQQDAMSVREAGWIQVHCENNQEILDMIIQGYRIAEHPDVLIPVNVCYDGFYLSHLAERVEIPAKSEVSDFVKTMKINHLTLDPNNPMSVDPMTSGPRVMKFRESHLKALQDSIEIIDQIDKEFAEKFGRSYGGVIDTYKCEDADYVILTIGSPTGTAREAIDVARTMGKKVGLVKVRFMRPFPSERIKSVLKNKKGFAVVDRSVAFGFNAGPLYVETKTAISDLGYKLPSFSAIGGLGGADITLNHILGCIDKVEEIINTSSTENQTVWLNWD